MHSGGMSGQEFHILQKKKEKNRMKKKKKTKNQTHGEMFLIILLIDSCLVSFLKQTRTTSLETMLPTIDWALFHH